MVTMLQGKGPQQRRLRWPAAVRIARALPLVLLAERDRWVLWLPVFYGAGIGAYFLPGSEPAVWTGPAALAGSLLCLACSRMLPVHLRRLGMGLLIPLPVCAAGFAIAQFHAQAVAAPVLLRETGPVLVAGRVLAVEPQEQAGRWRVTLGDVVFPGREARLPGLRKARITVRTGGVVPYPGEAVQTLAILFPPGEPDLPGGFDFARTAWFQGLGAVGFSVSPLALSDRPLPPLEVGGELRQAIARFRGTVTDRILDAMPQPEGAVAAALLSGERGAIPEHVVASYRDSGIAHLLAISGLHLGLVAGLLFVAMRAMLAAWPRLALTQPIKKWAAIFALAGALVYLVLTGAAVSTQRATLMAALVFAAILLDRQAISMRSVAWAAFIVLTLAPESLLSPGFQMSFAAVIALIAAYEGQRTNRLAHRLAERGGWPAHAARLLLYFAAVLLTTVIAGLATAPFAAFHFHRVVDYALVANLVAVPATALWIMPFGILALVLMPLGLEVVALVPMGWGLLVVNETAAAVASWPGAVRSVPAMPMSALVAMVFGALWVLLWRQAWRWGGIVGIAAGIWLAATIIPPDILVDGKGETIAVRLDRDLLFQGRSFLRRRVAESWSRATGLRAAAPWPQGEPLADADGASLTCDQEGCLYARNGQVIALPFGPDALVRDCRVAQAVIASFAIRLSCPSADRVIDARLLSRQGGLVLWIRDDGSVITETVAERRGTRLWSGQ